MRSLVASLRTWAPAAHHIARASLRAPPATARPGARRILTGVHDGTSSERASGNELGETLQKASRNGGDQYADVLTRLLADVLARLQKLEEADVRARLQALEESAADHKLYNNITLLLPPDTDGDDGEQLGEPQPKRMGKASRATIRRVLDRYDCDLVKDPDSGGLVPLEALQLQDGMTITAEQPERTSTIKQQVEDLPNWQRTMSKVDEEEAAKAMFIKEVAEEHSGEVTQRVFVSKVLSKNGQMREIDGMAVTADGHVLAILKAKTKVDIDRDIEELQSAMKFLWEQPLADPVLQSLMKRAKVVYGYLAYKVLPDSEAEVAELLDKCKKLNIRVLHTSGKAMAQHQADS